ncbi:hypothetical protein GDO81_012132 [Engystomops pustulosus]|uniref:Uncharacterized protein n=1 Tax=Engystomops pustulosus TaxID=76066 RepID=A0AAV7BJK1_ENGPU|nr:hypothetical protein GDO81_012132 [Engystomops pustulosus]
MLSFRSLTLDHLNSLPPYKIIKTIKTIRTRNQCPISPEQRMSICTILSPQTSSPASTEGGQRLYMSQ